MNKKMGEDKNSTPKEKMTFLKWIDNFWYHHKAATIIGTFALIIVVIGMTQFLTKNEPDVFIYSVGHNLDNLTAVASDSFKDDMAAYFAQDYNGDGKVVVDFKEDAFVMVKTEEGNRYVYDPNAQMTETQRFNLELGMGDCVIYIMEPAFFNANTDYLVNLEDVLEKIPKNAISGKGIAVSDLKAYRNTALSRFPEDYVICVSRKKSNFSDDYYAGNIEFFKNLVEFNVVTDAE